jgi:putative transposase
MTGWRVHGWVRLDRRAVEEEIRKCGMPVIAEDVDARCSHVRRGWYWGSQEFSPPSCASSRES